MIIAIRLTFIIIYVTIYTYNKWRCILWQIDVNYVDIGKPKAVLQAKVNVQKQEKLQDMMMMLVANTANN